MTTLREAAQAVLDRWDSPRWEWHQGPTAALMADLRAALAEHFCDTHCTWADHAPGCVRAEPVQEPVAWLSRDDARLALWEAINKREFGNPTDDKLILDHLHQQGLWIGKYTAPPTELGQWT